MSETNGQDISEELAQLLRPVLSAAKQRSAAHLATLPAEPFDI